MTFPILPPLLLHPVADLRWNAFSVHPSTVIGLAAIGGWYLWAARRAPTADPATAVAGPPSARRTPTPLQRLSFFAGLLVIFLSLNGPVHDLSDYYLFSAHMVQHLLLTLVMPPLLLLGVPGWMVEPVLRWRPLAAVARAATRPIPAYALFNVTVAAWHVPALYNTAVLHHEVHIAQHLMFMVTAVLAWWPLLSPTAALPRLSYPGQMLYCFLMAVPMTIVAVYIAMADTILYPAYASAPRLWGISPMLDQHLGGLIMWVPGGLFFYGVMTVVFFKWVGRQEDGQAGAQVGWKPVAGQRV